MSPGAATTEHLTEDIIHTTAAATATSLVDSFLTVSIVKLAFLLIAQNLVCCLNFLELLSITTTIRMMRSCQLEVSLLDFFKISLFIDTKHLVELSVVDLLRGTTATTATAHFLKIPKGEASLSEEHVLSC